MPYGITQCYLPPDRGDIPGGTEVTAGPAESNGSLWRDSLHVTCGLTACTPGSAPGPTLGNDYGKSLPF